MRLAIVAAALLAIAASPGGCGGPAGGASYDPCAGKACGASCQLCPPDAGDCVETTDVKDCDPNGRCTTAGSFTCPVYDPCAGKNCGDPCDIGLMGPAPTLCDRLGLCRYADSTPEGIWSLCDACAGKVCGESCDPCPPGTTCVAVMSSCDPLEACVQDGSFSCQ